MLDQPYQQPFQFLRAAAIDETIRDIAIARCRRCATYANRREKARIALASNENFKLCPDCS